MYVDISFRRQGIFRLLLNRVIELGAQHEVKALRLYVDKENELAQNVYLRNGFRDSNYALFEYAELRIKA